MPQWATWARSYLPGVVIGCALLAACGAKVNVPPEAPQAVRRGDEAYRYHDYEGAIGHYTAHTELIEKDEYTARALYKTALSQNHLGRFREAIDTLDDLHRRYPDAQWVQVDALRGDTERALGHSEKAIAAWDEGWQVASDNDRSKLRVRIATVARSMSNLELAQARQSAKADEVQQILEDQIAKRAKPELNEPIPEFEAAESDVELAAAEHPPAKATPTKAGKGKKPEPTPVAEIPDEEEADTEPLVAEPPPPSPAKAVVESTPSAWDVAEAPAPPPPPPPPPPKHSESMAEPAAANAADPDAVTKSGKIAVLLPMSGLDALNAQRALGAIELVIDSASVVVRDSQDNSAAATRAFNEISRDPSVLAVIGPLDTETARALAPAATTIHLPLLTLSPAEDASAPFVLQVGAPRQQLVGRLLDYAMNRARLRRFAIVYPDDASGHAFTASFKAQVEKRGGTVIGSDAYAPDAKSLTAGLVHRWRDDGNLQGLVLSDGASAANNFARFLQREMPDIPLLGISSWDSLTEADQPLSGVVFASPFYSNSSRRGVHDFVTRYEHAYGRTPGALEAEAYDAAVLLKHALAAGARSRAEVWRNLMANQDVEGGSGSLVVTPSGVQRDVVILQLVAGKLVELDSSASATADQAAAPR